MTTLTSYQTISSNLAKWQTLTAKKGEVSTQTAYFKAHIGSVKSADDLLKDKRLFAYAMTAYGLSDKTNAQGLMRKVLQQGVTSSTALANTLNNPNIKAFAKDFNFAAKGAATVNTSGLVAKVVDAYTETALETDQASANPGVELALYFKRKAPAVTSPYGLIADAKLLKVVQTALDISPMTAMQPVDQQAKLLANKVKIADFADPKKLDSFIARFTAMYDSKNAQTSGSSGANAVLLGGSGSALGPGVDSSMLMKMQR